MYMKIEQGGDITDSIILSYCIRNILFIPELSYFRYWERSYWESEIICRCLFFPQLVMHLVLNCLRLDRYGRTVVFYSMNSKDL